MNRQTNTTQFFYQSGKLVTVNQGGQHRAIFRSADMPLAELSTGERQETGLLEVDQNGSVLKVSGEADDEESHCYSAYGHDPSLPSQRTSSGFNGEQLETVAAAYLLGHGYRLFSPRLLRFHSADSISPFGRGGLNAYAYCNGDPVNNIDPSGHFSWFRRTPVQRIKHYYKKVHELKLENQKNSNEIERYTLKIRALKSTRNFHNSERIANNNPDQHGNRPSDYYWEAVDKINRNRSKKSNLVAKQSEQEERISRNEEKLASSRLELEAQRKSKIDPSPAYEAPPSYESLNNMDSVTTLSYKVRNSAEYQ